MGGYNSYSGYDPRQILATAAAMMAGGARDQAAEAYLKAAEAYVIRGRVLEGLALGFTALQAAPTRFVALVASGLLLRLGPTALPLCRRAITLHLEGHRAHDATGLLELVIQIAPRDADARIALADTYASTGMRDRALAMEAAALRMFESEGNNRDTILVARHMLGLDARHREALHALIRCHVRIGESDLAMSAISTLLKLDPTDEIALEAVARIMVHRGHEHRGLDVLRQLTASLGPTRAAEVLGRARRWCGGEEFRNGIEDLRRSTDDGVIELTGEDIVPMTA